MKTHRKLILPISVVTLLASCLTGCVSDTTINQVSVAKPIDVQASQEKKPIMFKRIVVKVKRGDEIGTIHLGLFNIPKDKLYWRRGGYLNFTDEDFNDRFREELEAANYEVVGNPDALFDDPTEWKAELLVAGLVTDLKLNSYYQNVYNMSYSRGTAYLKVEWQIYSRLERKVVLTITTEGSVDQKKATKNGIDDALGDAFSIAVRNLLGQQQFHDLVISSSSGSKMEGKSAKVQFKDPVASGNVVDKMADIKSSVVTLFAGDEMGSGFVISDNGYILSNQHVVGDSRYVRIKFSTGVEANGEVVSINRLRDVALIKCGEQGLLSLPIQRELPKTGEDVYAIGTPVKEYFNQTVTKGIVSGYRTMDGINYIQSDVSINPGNSGGPLLDSNGNVIGLAVLKRTDAVSLGFFVPIGEAISSLEIK